MTFFSYIKSSLDSPYFPKFDFKITNHQLKDIFMNT